MSVSRHVVTVLLAVVCGATVAAAQESGSDAQTFDDGVVEEIVVTAQKRTQTLSEVPISLATLDSEFIRRTGIDNFEEASRFIPNFNFYQGFDRSEVAINIRGLTSGTSNPGIDPSVGFFIDGVYIARPAALTGKLTDIARLEVLRGPQGTLYGRNTSAGAVNLYTTDPSDELEASLLAGYGNYDALDLRARVSNTLPGDSVGFVLSAFYDQADSYLDNVATGDPLGDVEDFGGRLKLVVEPNDSVSIRLAADYSESNATASAAVGAFRKDQADLFTVLGAAAAAMNPALAGNVRFVQDVPVDTFDRATGRSDEPQADDLEQYGVSAEISVDLGFATLTSLTAYRESEDFAAIDPDFSAADLFLTSVRNEDEQFSEELRLASNASGSPLDYLLGLYLFDSEFVADTQTSFGVPLFGQFNAAMPPNPIVEPQSANSVSAQETEAFAAFGQLAYHFTDSLSLTYGFRYNDESKEGVINQNPDRGINSESGIPFPLQFPVLVGLQSEVDDDDFINMVSLNYELGVNSNLYAAYSEGLKSGGINASILLNTNALTFEKETSRNYEIGYRNVLDNGLRFNTALFFMTFDQLQVQTFDPSNPANIIVTNAGEAEIFGVEADAYWSPVDGLELNAAVAYNDSQYKDTVFPGFEIGQNPQIPGVDLRLPAVADVDGRTLSRAPEWTFTLGAQYSFPLSDDWQVSLRADYSYIDSQFLDPILSPQSEIDAYNLVNLRASVETADGLWRFTLFGNNVFDEEYYSQLVASPGAAGLLVDPTIATWLGVQGAPATYGIELTRNF